MGMGARRADTWTEEPAAAAEENPQLPEATWHDEVATLPSSPAGLRIATLVLGVLALGWIGLLGFGFASLDATLLGVAQDFAIACVPLVLLAVLMVLLRGSSPLRFGGNAAAMRIEVAALHAQLANLSGQLAQSRETMTEHREHVDATGSLAALQLTAAGAALRDDAALLSRQGRTLEFAAAAARADLAVLLEGMPRLEGEARALSTILKGSGADAETRIHALGLALSTLAQQGRDVDESAGGAASRLAGLVDELGARTASVRGQITAAGGDMSQSVDGALTHAASALEQTRAGIDAQAAAVRGLMEQARGAFDKAGFDTEAGAKAQLTILRAELDRIGEKLSAQGATARNLIGDLNTGLQAIEERFAGLGETGTAEAQRLAETVQGIAGYAEQVREGLVVGGDAADALIERATALGARLEEPARQLHEAMPGALAKLDQQARRSLVALSEAVPQVVKLDAAAAAAATRLEVVAGSLTSQNEASTALIADIDRQLARSRDGALALDQAITDAGTNATRVADGSAAVLVEAMVRVRETATQVAERARETIATVIPDSAAALAEASEAALSRGVTSAVEHQVARLGQLGNEAADAAARAADRLSGQLLELSRTTASVERRIVAGREEAEAAERDSFPRRSAQLIDALNSTAIDVAKILSTEVTDSQWAAYLRGDRGIFTRRAVRLLDAAEAREIAGIYGSDPEFRDQVNRYVHDFEALLRPIVASRDGAPLAVTLVGSDMGKLYVALAQAISRLRG